MNDQKEQIANNIAIKMNLNAEDTRKLKNIIYMELYEYSLEKIHNTDLAVGSEKRRSV